MNQIKKHTKDILLIVCLVISCSLMSGCDRDTPEVGTCYQDKYIVVDKVMGRSLYVVDTTTRRGYCADQHGDSYVLTPCDNQHSSWPAYFWGAVYDKDGIEVLPVADPPEESSGANLKRTGKR